MHLKKSDTFGGAYVYGKKDKYLESNIYECFKRFLQNLTKIIERVIMTEEINTNGTSCL